MTQLVKQTQVLLPCIVDDVQHYHAFKLLYNVLCLCAVSLLEIARNIVYTLAVGDRHHDALIYCTLVLLYLLDDRPSNTLDTVGLALECSHCALEGALLKVFTLCIVKLFLAERTLHSQNLKELLAASLIVVLLNDIDNTVPDNVCYIHTDTLAHKSMATLLVYYSTLLVHHVIVLKQVLTYTEVVLLNLLLSTLDALRNHRVLNTVALLESEAVHKACNTL